jgi:ABC-type polysaccharide/polyol phosphate export permease
MDMGVEATTLKPMWTKSPLLLSPFVIFKENFQHRELIKRLIQRDLRSRYRGPWLGYAWSLLEPLLLAIVYSFVFGIIVGKSDPTYPVVVMIGVIGWSLFSKCLTGTTKTLTSNAGLFEFTKIPKSVFAVSNVATNTVLSFISLFALLPLLLFYDIPFQATLLLLPLFLFLLAVAGTSFGLIIAPYAVRVPDFVNVVQFIARVGFFLSPVMWTYPMLSSKFGDGLFLTLAHLNPVIVPITLMRDIVLGTSSGIPTFGYTMFTSVTLGVFVTGTMVFQRKAHKMVVGL